MSWKSFLFSPFHYFFNNLSSVKTEAQKQLEIDLESKMHFLKIEDDKKPLVEIIVCHYTDCPIRRNMTGDAVKYRIQLAILIENQIIEFGENGVEIKPTTKHRYCGKIFPVFSNVSELFIIDKDWENKVKNLFKKYHSSDFYNHLTKNSCHFVKDFLLLCGKTFQEVLGQSVGILFQGLTQNPPKFLLYAPLLYDKPQNIENHHALIELETKAEKANPEFEKSLAKEENQKLAMIFIHRFYNLQELQLGHCCDLPKFISGIPNFKDMRSVDNYFVFQF